MVAEFNWQCPFCGNHQTVTNSKVSTGTINFRVGENALCPDFGLYAVAIGCSNPDCKQVEITAYVGAENSNNNSINMRNLYVTSRLMPESSAKPQPDYIPVALREDYLEACRIRDLSPKAASTLIRRCLQGMIRDFCGIAEPTLNREISRLRQLVEEDKAPPGVSVESIDAIDHVRSIGNIGAHMEADINHIIPVDPEEAQILIGLTETLFEEWYVARHRRRDRLRKLKETADGKKMLKSNKPQALLEPPSDDG